MFSPFSPTKLRRNMTKHALPRTTSGWSMENPDTVAMPTLNICAASSSALRIRIVLGLITSVFYSTWRFK